MDPIVGFGTRDGLVLTVPLIAVLFFVVAARSAAALCARAPNSCSTRTGDWRRPKCEV